MFVILALLGGLIFLGLGAEWFTRGAVALALHFKMSRRFIGLTLASLGGGLPALATLVQVAHNGSGQLVAGASVGGSLFTLLGGLGALALFKPFHPTRNMRLTDGLSLFLAAVAVFYGLSHFAGDAPLPRWLGAAGLGLAILYATWAYLQKDRTLPHIPTIKRKVHPLLTGGLALAGLFALMLGATLLVRGALQLNQSWLVSDFLLGFTILAWGMVLPTLAIFIATSFDPQVHPNPAHTLVGLALFTLLAVPAYLQILHPFTLPTFQSGPALAMLGAASIAAMLYLRPKQPFGREEGALFLAAYLLCLWQAFISF